MLTEEDHFNGSLEDLITAKRRFPELSFLRKDFLFHEDDIDVSFRAGADAVLLIASILESERLKALYDSATKLGMTALVEVHDDDDLAKIARIRPACVGCNARNLETFLVDPLVPIELRNSIDWRCETIYESGVWEPEHAELAASTGFDAILVGESVVRNPGLVSLLIEGFSRGDATRDFWKRIALRRRARRPLAKICGLTTSEDVNLACNLGADVLGFNFADSPRRTTPAFVRGLTKTDALKVAVVVTGSGKSLDSDIVDLYRDGAVDAIQFHGEETPVECGEYGIPYYKAVRIGSQNDIDEVSRFLSPRVLVDARTSGARGGTGVRIDDALVSKVGEGGPLWLAGGLNPDNVTAIVSRHGPELVDVASGLEDLPGKKDPRRMRRFFSELDGVSST